jgi:YjbE family integral membrane protein
MWVSPETLTDLAAIVWLDVVLSGDNALVIGMAAAGLAPHLQRRAIMFGMTAAVVIRIASALVATYLYEIPWVKFVGGLALLWVALKLYQEVRNISILRAEATGAVVGSGASKDRRSMMKALATITIADVSMSIDNVLAVAGIAQDNRAMLVFGLALSIMLMAFCATMVDQLYRCGGAGSGRGGHAACELGRHGQLHGDDMTKTIAMAATGRR